MNRGAFFNRTAASTLLAYTSGFVDTLTFIALFGLFSAHITGNFVLSAMSLAEYHHGLWLKLFAVPTFVVIAFCTRWFIIRRERHQLDATAHVLMAQAVLLFCFMLLAIYRSPFVDHTARGTLACGMLAVAAMAVQNTAARTLFSDLPPTTVMTGNLVQIVVDLVDLLHGHGASDAKRARLARLVPMVAGFVLGTLSGALGYVNVGFYCVIVPIISVTIVSIMIKSSQAAAA
ncbi:MAG TPA: YoaK family protein [Reyranella sp.]|nr:YoaK family protein [Reyranella sp.]